MTLDRWRSSRQRRALTPAYTMFWLYPVSMKIMTDWAMDALQEETATTEIRV
jgi:hypothetical protein